MSQPLRQSPAVADGKTAFQLKQWAPSHGYHESMASLLDYIQTKQLSPSKSVRQGGGAAPPVQRQRQASKPKVIVRKQLQGSKLLTSSKTHKPRQRANMSRRRASVTAVKRPRILDKPEIQALRHDLNHRRNHDRITTTTSLMAARDLHAAIESRDLGAVYTMLRSGVDPNLSRGGVVVTSASGRPSTPVSRRPAGGVGVTPLHRAFSVGCLEAAIFLVLAGADLEATNAAGETAVVRAVRCEFPDDFVALCCELGAGVDASDRSGRTALHYAAGLVHPDVSCGTVLALAAHGADLDARDAEGRAPLHAAVTAGRAEVVLQLAGRGADVEAALPGGATPLHLAVLRRNAQIVRVLCEHGVDVNGKAGIGGRGGSRRDNNRGGAVPKTPLICAIETGCTEIVRILLKHGADVNMQSSDSKSDGGATDANPSNSTTSSKGGGTSTSTTKAQPQAGSFPLLAAARLGNAAVVELLLARNADPDLTDASRQTPLHAAAAHNHIDVVRRLVAAGAAVGRMRDDGATPLLLAVRAGHEAVARYLLLGPIPAPAESPAEELGPGRWGPTALWHAVDRGHREIAKLLVVDRGADPLRVVDAWGSTPLHHAAKKGLDGLVELVLDRMAGGHDGGEKTPAGLVTGIGGGSNGCEFTVSLGNETRIQGVKPQAVKQEITSGSTQKRSTKIWKTGEIIQATEAITATGEVVKPSPTNSKIMTAEAQISNLRASLLLAAAEGGQLSTLKLLLARCGMVSGLTDLQRAQTAAGDGILAVATASPEMLRFLLGFKMSDDGEAKSGGGGGGGSSGSSIWAAILGRPRRSLLDVNHRNRHGATALHYAALRGHVEGARVLLQKGAKQSVTVEIYENLDDYADKRNYRQGTPAGLARQRGFHPLAAMIDKWR